MDPGEVAQAADSEAVSRKPSKVEPKIGLETQVASGQTAIEVEANTTWEATNACTRTTCRGESGQRAVKDWSRNLRDPTYWGS
jgi:hypothetical protein